MIKIGEHVEFEVQMIGNKKFKAQGIVYGRVKSLGGWKYLIKEWNLIDPPNIGKRNVYLKK